MRRWGGGRSLRPGMWALILNAEKRQRGKMMGGKEKCVHIDLKTS